MTDPVQLLREVGSFVPTGVPPVDEVLALGHRRRLHSRSTTVVGAAAATLVAVAVGVVMGSGVQVDRPGPTSQLSVVAEVDNPVPLPWWADGVLHLDHLAVSIPAVEGLVVVPDGVVLADERGTVWHVLQSGKATEIGGGVSTGQLAADPDSGWVAWVSNPGQGKDPILRVYDANADRLVGERALTRKGPRWEVLDEGDHPIAIVGEVVYYADQDGDYAWDVLEGEPERRTGPDTYLLDVAGGASLTTQHNGFGQMQIDSAAWPAPRTLDASWGLLSPTGRYALGHSNSTGVKLFRDGTEIPTGLPPTGRVLSFAFAGDSSAVFVLGSGPGRLEPNYMGPRIPYTAPFRIVVCDTQQASCSTLVRRAGTQTLPLLAQ